MIGKDKILDLLNSVLKKSRADQTEAVFIGGENGLTRFANSAIHQNVSERNSRVYLRAVLGKKIGVASTNSLIPEDLEKSLANATEIAKNQKENPDFPGLPGKADFSQLNTYFERTAKFSPTERAEALKRIFDKAGASQLNTAGSFTTGDSEIAVINSNGAECYQPLTSAYLNLIVMGENSSGFADQQSRDVGQIQVDDLAEVAIKKCVESKDPKGVEPGEYQVVLEPSAVAALVEWMNYIGFGCKAFQEGTSFMSNRIGQKIMGENVTMYDDGTDGSAIAFPFDFEGVPKQKVALVEKGVAKGVVYDSISANKEQKKSTGHALTPDNAAEGGLALNLFIEGGDSSLEKMIESVKKGILVTRFHYINGFLDTTNALLTGMTRDGTFWVEDGKIKHGIKNLRFTESMLKAFSNVQEISRDTKIVASWWEDVGCIVAPAMLIDKFKFTGKTEF
ncbi:MAG: TldD/PmbA family protein [Candidatus Zixiibacteriota bacterium]|nr:MAG: TldD/PmbA family protein [candidate division Zixibacteria bacterium]